MSGGDAAKGAKLRSVEVLHSDGSPWCSLPDLPRSRSHHSQTGLEACGGTTSDFASYDDDDYNPDSDSTDVTCIHFNGGSWNHSQTNELIIMHLFEKRDLVINTKLAKEKIAKRKTIEGAPFSGHKNIE